MIEYKYEVSLRFFDGVDDDYAITKSFTNSRLSAWRTAYEKLREREASAACGGFYVRITSKGAALCEYTKNKQGRIVRH